MDTQKKPRYLQAQVWGRRGPGTAVGREREGKYGQVIGEIMWSFISPDNLPWNPTWAYWRAHGHGHGNGGRVINKRKMGWLRMPTMNEVAYRRWSKQSQSSFFFVDLDSDNEKSRDSYSCQWGVDGWMNGVYFPSPAPISSSFPWPYSRKYRKSSRSFFLLPGALNFILQPFHMNSMGTGEGGTMMVTMTAMASFLSSSCYCPSYMQYGTLSELNGCLQLHCIEGDRQLRDRSWRDQDYTVSPKNKSCSLVVTLHLCSILSYASYSLWFACTPAYPLALHHVGSNPSPIGVEPFSKLY